MTGKNSAFCVLFLTFLMSMIGASSLYGARPTSNPSGKTALATSGSPQQSKTDLTGTWSGSFKPNHSAVAPFTMTVVISSDPNGHLVGDASLVAHCLKSHRLYVTVNGPDVVLAGTDADGDNATFRGALDETGTQLTLKYMINGSASARCEIENGTGNLSKR
jgi:hypothetical protein